MAVGPVGLTVALALLWGSGFFWIKLSLGGFSPVQVTFARLLLGALVLAVIVVIRRVAWPRGLGTWGHLTVAALLSNALPYGLVAFAEQTVPSSLAGALNATTPLWTAAIAYGVGTERPMTARRVVGLLVGLAGVLVVLSPWSIVGVGTVAGLLACLAATASYGLGYVYQARYLTNRGVSSLVLAASQLGAAAGLLVLALPLGGREPIHPTGTAVIAILILGLLGTGLAYVINFALIASQGATATSLVFYLLPVVAAVLGIAVLDEPARWALILGLVLVLGGVALVRRSSTSAASPAGEAE